MFHTFFIKLEIDPGFFYRLIDDVLLFNGIFETDDIKFWDKYALDCTDWDDIIGIWTLEFRYEF